MKTSLFFKLILFVAVIFTVSAQEAVDPLASPVPTENVFLQQITGLAQKISDYNSYIHAMIRNAKNEMAENNSERPSTRYTFDDIVFTVTKKLPTWVYPVSCWKQDSITRRRQIAKTIHSSLSSRPFSTKVRDDTVEWITATSKSLEDYFEHTRFNFKSLFDASQEYISIDIDSHDSLENDAKQLKEKIDDFYIINSYNFSKLIEHTNNKFDDAVNMAGDLRVPMESVRYDTIHTITEARNNFINSLEAHFNPLVQYANHELSNKSISSDLKRYIAKSAREELGSFSDIVTEFGRLKYITNNVLKTAAAEFKQTPGQMSYWVDAFVELTSADWSLGSFAKNLQTEKDTCCTN
ncbi:hypothetical protein K501DRAFT_42372 [Backusella circina FSU 941]|nr:hypothetical protein K501DRAFT_42372 [Backusella circina FSU 941]